MKSIRLIVFITYLNNLELIAFFLFDMVLLRRRQPPQKEAIRLTVGVINQAARPLFPREPAPTASGFRVDK